MPPNEAGLGTAAASRLAARTAVWRHGDNVHTPARAATGVRRPDMPYTPHQAVQGIVEALLPPLLLLVQIPEPSCRLFLTAPVLPPPGLGLRGRIPDDGPFPARSSTDKLGPTAGSVNRDNSMRDLRPSDHTAAGPSRVPLGRYRGNSAGRMSPGKPSAQPLGTAVRSALRDSAMRGTECVNCARSFPGKRCSNAPFYPAPVRRVVATRRLQPDGQPPVAALRRS